MGFKKRPFPHELDDVFSRGTIADGCTGMRDIRSIGRQAVGGA